MYRSMQVDIHDAWHVPFYLGPEQSGNWNLVVWWGRPGGNYLPRTGVPIFLASLQPGPANYTKHRNLYSNQLIKHDFCDFLWFPLWLRVVFLCSFLFKLRHMGCPSSELPCFKTAKHAIYIVFINILDESCGALVLKTLFILYTSSKLQWFGGVWVALRSFVLVSARGSISLGKHIFLEPTLGKWRKGQKLNVFWSKSLTLVELRI